MRQGADGKPRGRSDQSRAPGLETWVLRVSDTLAAAAPAALRRLLERPLPSATSTPERSASAIASTLAWLALVSGVGLAVAQLGQELVLGDPVLMFDADEEGNVWAWTHVVALVSATSYVALFAAQHGARRAPWFAAATLLFLSADELLEIHGRVAGTVVFFPHAGRLIWPLLYFPLLASLLIVLWRGVEPHGDRARAMVRGGLLLLCAAVLLELASVGVYVVSDGVGLLYNLEVALEEGAEVAGWLLIAGGFASVVVATPGTARAATDDDVAGED